MVHSNGSGGGKGIQVNLAHVQTLANGSLSLTLTVEFERHLAELFGL